MNREYHTWYSQNLGREMELLAFGHAGPAMLVFPTSMGRFFEFEDRSMVSALGHRLEAGTLQLFCVDSIDKESWYNYSAFPGDRIARHLQYERYILDEVMPLMRSRLPEGNDGRVGAMGLSLGAFHAALLALRHPQTIDILLAVSGKYENSSFLYGHSSTDAYLTNPLAFLRDLHDDAYLSAMRQMAIIIVSGSTDPHIHEARELSQLLWDKAVPNTLDVWDGWMHDWPYWKDMVGKWA